MRRSVRTILAATALAAAFLPAPAAFANPEVRGAITAQLAAFAAGDADAAYALAAPSIQRLFPSAARFVAMVKQGYAPVTSARATVFLRGRETGEGAFAQEVGFIDEAGQPWTALYTLTRQPNGEWRIDGCYLRRTPGTSA